MSARGPNTRFKIQIENPKIERDMAEIPFFFQFLSLSSLHVYKYEYMEPSFRNIDLGNETYTDVLRIFISGTSVFFASAVLCQRQRFQF